MPIIHLQTPSPPSTVTITPIILEHSLHIQGFLHDCITQGNRCYSISDHATVPEVLAGPSLLGIHGDPLVLQSQGDQMCLVVPERQISNRKEDL